MQKAKADSKKIDDAYAKLMKGVKAVQRSKTRQTEVRSVPSRRSLKSNH